MIFFTLKDRTNFLETHLVYLYSYRVVMAKNIQINLETKETLEVKLAENEFSS